MGSRLGDARIEATAIRSTGIAAIASLETAGDETDGSGPGARRVCGARPTARRSARAGRRGRLRRLALVVIAAAFAACASDGSLGDPAALLRAAAGPAGVDASTAASGLREALSVGTRRTVDRVGARGGYLDYAPIRIPLPEQVEGMASALRTVGFGAQVDELEVGMNRAAEQAAGEATEVFVAAVRSMTIDDALGILRGGDTAATDFFRLRTSDEIRGRFEPIVSTQIERIGLGRLYNALARRASALPFVRQPPASLNAYVTDSALEGLFTVLGEEEQRIRSDPAARTTALLQQVFAQ